MTTDRDVVVREFPVEVEVGAGRTLDVRIVPYGKPAEVSDGGPIYREEWVEGAFDDQLVAGHRLQVFMNFEHERGIGGVIGDGVSLRSQPDGLHGSFELLDGPDGDKALSLIKRGKLRGISLEAYVKKTLPSADGVVRRVKAHLQNVALCRRGAFPDAEVLAVRKEPIFDEDQLPFDMDPELVERCRQLVPRVPQRYEAHPDKNGHPHLMGTPEDGTRQPVTAATSGGKDERHTE